MENGEAKCGANKMKTTKKSAEVKCGADKKQLMENVEQPKAADGKCGADKKSLTVSAANDLIMDDVDLLVSVGIVSKRRNHHDGFVRRRAGLRHDFIDSF